MRSERKKMDITHFQELSIPEQLNTIWQVGSLLETRRVPGFWLNLYAVNRFFVEVWICQRRYDATLLRSFSDTDELEPFIDRVSLTSILPC